MHLFSPALVVPVPRDLDLPLPLSADALSVILVLLFLLHILFVNLMVGGSVLTVIFEIIGLSRPRYDLLARRIGETITVNKSLAVVLGVGPLLCISLLYTTYFYTANALTGYAWISIVPLVIGAFLLTYLHKYTWERWRGPLKPHHIAQGVAAVGLFLSIPLIFLSNINLMLFPETWTGVQGFWGALRVGNVFPRYFHFMTASLAITGLFLVGWFGRRSFPLEEKLAGFTRPELRRLFYRIAFFVTLAQLAIGPFLLLSLPVKGISILLLWIVLGGISVATLLLVLMWRETRADDQSVGHLYPIIVPLFLVLVVVMGSGRHVYREASLATHRQLVADRTGQFRAVRLAANMRLAAGLGIGDAIAEGPTGASVFRNCAACHALDRVLAAPPLTEVYSLYKDNPDGIIIWAKNPGKKRAEFNQMPSMAHLGDEQLRLVAQYILSIADPDQSTASDSATAVSVGTM
jgi:cytochrome c